MRDRGVIRLSDVEERPVDWLWKGLLAPGAITMLDGDPGVGKSFLVASIAAHLTSGRALPGGPDVAPSNVLLVDMENDPARSLKPRIHAAGGDQERVCLLPVRDRVEAFDLARRADVQAIERAVAEHDIGLVVIDPLMAVLGSAVDTFRDQDVRRVLLGLSRMAEVTGCAVLLVRHLNKAMGGPALYRGGGSIGIIGAARVGLLMTKHPDEGNLRFLAATKSNLGPLPQTLRIVLDGDEESTPVLRFDGVAGERADDLVGVGDESARSAVEEAEAFLIDQLTSGPQPYRDLARFARDAGVSVASLRRARARLKIDSRPVPRVGQRGHEGWMWALPAPQDDQLVQPPDVSTLNKLNSSPVVELAAPASPTAKNACPHCGERLVRLGKGRPSNCPACRVSVPCIEEAGSSHD